MTVQVIFLLVIAADTFGGYKWRHLGDFSISYTNPPKTTPKLKRLKKKFSPAWTCIFSKIVKTSILWVEYHSSTVGPGRKCVFPYFSTEA